METKKELTDIEKLIEPLAIEDIEFRIGSSKKNSGFSLLAYKTARTDVKRLNEVFGLNWSNEYFYDSKGLLCSKISVLSNGNWVSRIDVGTESNTEKEKGSYSDAFKRTGFKYGIGAELYNFPFIWLQWSDWNDYNGKVTPNFQVSNLKIDEYECLDGEVKQLKLSYKGKVVYSLGTFPKAEKPKQISNGLISEKVHEELKVLIKGKKLDYQTVCTNWNMKSLSELLTTTLPDFKKWVSEQ